MFIDEHSTYNILRADAFTYTETIFFLLNFQFKINFGFAYISMYDKKMSDKKTRTIESTEPAEGEGKGEGLSFIRLFQATYDDHFDQFFPLVIDD